MTLAQNPKAFDFLIAKTLKWFRLARFFCKFFFLHLTIYCQTVSLYKVSPGRTA